jgi:hypothetical protein
MQGVTKSNAIIQVFKKKTIEELTASEKIGHLRDLSLVLLTQEAASLVHTHAVTLSCSIHTGVNSTYVILVSIPRMFSDIHAEATSQDE